MAPGRVAEQGDHPPCPTRLRRADRRQLRIDCRVSLIQRRYLLTQSGFNVTACGQIRPRNGTEFESRSG